MIAGRLRGKDFNILQVDIAKALVKSIAKALKPDIRIRRKRMMNPRSDSMSNEENNGIMEDLGEDDFSGSEETTKGDPTWCGWIRCPLGQQTKDPRLVAMAKNMGTSAQRALANGNTRLFNAMFRKFSYSVNGKLANESRKLVDPNDVAKLEAMLKTAKVAKAKADSQK